MINKQKFSILLSIYYKESPSCFRQSLESIFHQTLSPDEVFIVKDGLLPMELEMIVTEFQQQYEELKTLDLPTNHGLGKALNEGLKFCSHNIIARMDTDDIAKPYRFEKQIAIFENNPNIDVVGSWIDEFDEDITNISSTRKLPEKHEDIYKYAKKRNPINHPVSMFRKSAVISAGGYQHFPFFEDYYLWVRLLMNGAKFYNIQESLLFFRLSPDMFKRRGGWKYVLNELRFQNTIRKIGFITSFEFIRNLSIRIIVRIIPNCLRRKIYKNILRK